MEHVEGWQSVLAAIIARQRHIELVLLSRGAHEEKSAAVRAAALERDVPVKIVEWSELDAMAHGSSHGGVLAICSPKPRWPADRIGELLEKVTSPAIFLLLEGVDDARNLGFTLRTAEAMGVTAVLIKKHLWDFDAVEVARPSSGAYERLPLVQIDSVAPLVELQKRGIALLGCIAGVRRTLYDVDLASPIILAIGGEKRGLSGAVRSICDTFITIPTVGGASSLSLSHAGAIVLSEVMRQRLAAAR